MHRGFQREMRASRWFQSWLLFCLAHSFVFSYAINLLLQLGLGFGGQYGRELLSGWSCERALKAVFGVQEFSALTRSFIILALAVGSFISGHGALCLYHSCMFSSFFFLSINFHNTTFIWISLSASNSVTNINSLLNWKSCWIFTFESSLGLLLPYIYFYARFFSTMFNVRFFWNVNEESYFHVSETVS